MKEEITFRSDIAVTLINYSGSDTTIARAAWVSEPNDARGLDGVGVEGVIKAMMKGKHGSPFEQNYLQFYVEAPIFVFREWMRHRIGFGYNEVSARYRRMKPQFYFPPIDRPFVEPDGFKPMRPVLEHGEATDYGFLTAAHRLMYHYAWDIYSDMIDNGIAREVARNVLPVGTYSAMHVSCNARSLMHFLSLRTSNKDAAVRSYPLWEIEQAALSMEAEFAKLFPITHKAFVDNGRVAP